MKKVLIIGSKFQYGEIDFAFLKGKSLDIYLSYLEGDIPLKNARAVFYKKLDTKSIIDIIIENGITVLVCYKDDFLYSAAEIRTQCNLSGLQLNEVRKYKHKSVMYDLASEKVKTSPYIQYSHELQFSDLISTLGEPPFFIKPDNLAGAEGSMKLSNEADFQLWKEYYSKYYSGSIIQPFLNEKLYHCELIVQDNKELYNLARIYSYPNHNFLDGKIIVSLPIPDSEIKRKVEEAASLVREALGFKNGLMHTEFFVSSDNKITFLETNIRQVGGTISLIHKDIIGMSFETALILIESDIAIEQFDIDESHYHFAGYIPQNAGVVSRFNMPEFQGEVEVNFRVKIGDKLKSPISTSNAAASIFGKYDDYQKMMFDFHFIEQNQLVEYVP
jgi:biotin carboxylase